MSATKKPMLRRLLDAAGGEGAGAGDRHDAGAIRRATAEEHVVDLDLGGDSAQFEAAERREPELRSLPQLSPHVFRDDHLAEAPPKC